MNEIEITRDEYQEFIETTWIKKDGVSSTEEELRVMCGLIEEVGEIAGKIKKFYRDDTDPEEFRKDILKEMGDVQYYAYKLLNFYDLNMSDVIRYNVAKLSSRKERGVLHGSGDNR